MNSEQIPPEFEWIKPGVKAVERYYCPNCHPEIVEIKGFPFFSANYETWLVKGLNESGFRNCAMLRPNPDVVSLTLTREQAEQLKADLYREYMCGSVLGIIQQIEEKLK